MPKALIVDDIEENLYYLRALLSAHGYEVDEARHGKQALALAHSAPPDIVISDILMPVMDGFALCSAWRGEAQLANIPFVIYTGTYTDTRDEELALDLGADVFLLKPLEPQQLMDAIGNAVSRRGERRSVRPRSLTAHYAALLGAYNAALIHKLEDKLTQLDASERRLRSYLEAAPQGIVAISRGGDIEMVNGRIEEMFGYHRSELIGRPARALARELAPAPTEAHSGPSPRELSGRRKDGTEFPIEIGLSFIQTGDNMLALGVVSDITLRKRSEEERKRGDETRAFLASIVESSDDSIVGSDLNGNILSWNRAAERMFGYTAGEAVGKPINIFFLPDLKPEYLDSISRVRHHETIERFETTRARKDGTRVDVSVILSPIKDAGGTLVGVSAIYRDITLLKLRDAELLRAKEAAEAANRIKSEFLANMSHEIRTPMNGIIGMTDVLLDADPTTEQREYLNVVKASAESLLAIINDILDLSKIEAHKLSLNLHDFRLRDCVTATIRELDIQAQQKGLALRCRIQPEVPESVHGDETRLRQVLINLLGNAIKFTAAGEVGLAVETTPGDSDLLRFSVSDTGSGVPLDKQAMIFDAFTQADNSATRKFGGTGLGLAISTRLVEMMGGRIWVESDGHSGSTFYFTAGLNTLRTGAE